MRDRYTMQELTAMLGADGNTVRRWLEALHIDPISDRYDARRKWVSAIDAQRVAEAHDRSLRPLPDDRPKTLPAALARIATLEAIVRQQEEEITTLKGARASVWSRLASHASQDASESASEGQETVGISEHGIYQPLPQKPRSSHRGASLAPSVGSSPGDTMPGDWQSLDEVAVQHGQSVVTLKDNIARQAIRCHLLDEAPHVKGWKRGRNWITRAVSPDQLALIFAVVPPKQQCKDGACPCHFVGEVGVIASPSSGDNEV